MAVVKRERRSAESWHALLTKQSESGLSIAAFCARERVSAASFYQWRTRLGMSPTQESSNRREAFVDLGALRDGCSRFELRIDLGGGVVLQLARG